MSPIELSCDYDSVNSMIQRKAVLRSPQREFSASRGPESASCVSDDGKSGTQWDNSRVIEGGNEIFVYSRARCR